MLLLIYSMSCGILLNREFLSGRSHQMYSLGTTSATILRTIMEVDGMPTGITIFLYKQVPITSMTI